MHQASSDNFQSTNQFNPESKWQIAIIIVAYEGDDWIPNCLESLEKSTQVNALVLLVDNKDNTKLKSGKFGSLSIHCFKTPHPMGFADANNFALMKVPRSVPNICFLNQDTISQSNWIERALESLNQNPKLGAISPMLRNYQGSDWDRDFQNSLKSQSGFTNKWLQVSPPSSAGSCHLVSDIPATAMIVKTDVIRRTGPFDPVFGSYYEDYDLCMRIRNSGHQLAICPGSTLYHYSGSISQTPEARKRQSRWIIRNNTLHKIRKATGPRLFLVCNLFILAGVRQLIRSILKTPGSSPLPSTILAYLDLLKILPRLLSKKLDQEPWKQFLESICWNNFATQPFEFNENTSR